MKNFLKLISLFLTVKIIATYDCLEHEMDNCKCYETVNGDIYFSCIDPTDIANENNPRRFEIYIETFEITVKCINSASLENFHYDFRLIVKDLTTLTLNNCIVNKNTDIKKIRELTGTEYIGKINLDNNFNLNDILINNPNRELTILIGLDITNNNNLKKITQILFQQVYNIFYLKIKKCSLETIEENAFYNLLRLLKLDLSENKLKFIQKTTFHDLHDLTDLDLSDNQLEILDDSIFQQLKFLKNLNLKKNKLTTISEFMISKLHFLETFNAAENLIETIHKNAFQNLFQLGKINLSKNKITQLSRENNKINIGPTVVWSNYSIFFSCHKLQELNLSFNNISMFYDDWFDLIQNDLHDLQLSYNQIPAFYIPHNFTIKSHNHINLSNNQLKTINLHFISSMSFESQSNLHIDGINNPIICDCLNDKLLQFIRGDLEIDVYKHLTINIMNLKCIGPKKNEGKLFTTLKTDDLSCQIITNQNMNNEKEACTTKYLLGQMKAMINCSNIGFKEIPENLGIIISFSSEIDLTNNHLEHIPEFSSIERKSITILHLSGNKIKHLTGIEVLENLEILELNNNDIQMLGEGEIASLKKLKKLKRVTLKGNPFLCGSYFEELKDMSKIKDNNNLTCSDESEKPIQEKIKHYSEEAVNSLCSLRDRDEVEKIWEQTCSVHF